MKRLLLAGLVIVSSSRAADQPISPLAEAPKAIHREAPRYPERAMRLELAGDVNVVVSIGDDGEPKSVDVSDEYPTGFGFAKSAVDAVEGWKFIPNRAGTYSVKTRFRIRSAPLVAPSLDLPFAPQPTNYVVPYYPPLALHKGLESKVDLVVGIGANGEVVKLGVVDIGDTDALAILGDAAYNAVARWRYPHDHAGFYRVTLEFSKAALAAGYVAEFPLQ